MDKIDSEAIVDIIAKYGRPMLEDNHCFCVFVVEDYYFSIIADEILKLIYDNGKDNKK